MRETLCPICEGGKFTTASGGCAECGFSGTRRGAEVLFIYEAHGPRPPREGERPAGPVKRLGTVQCKEKHWQLYKDVNNVYWAEEVVNALSSM